MGQESGAHLDKISACKRVVHRQSVYTTGHRLAKLLKYTLLNTLADSSTNVAAAGVRVYLTCTIDREIIQ